MIRQILVLILCCLPLLGEDLPKSAPLRELYQKLQAEGLHPNIFVEAPHPDTVNGKEKIAILVGDQHSNEWQKANVAVLKKISALGISTLCEEGRAYDLSTEKEAFDLYARYLKTVRDTLLSPEEAKEYFNTQRAWETTDNRTPMEYSKEVKFSRVVGIEGRQPRDFLSFLIFPRLHAALSELVAKVESKDGAFVAVEGKYLTEDLARLFAARGFLRREGFEFPLERVAVFLGYTKDDGSRFRIMKIESQHASTAKKWLEQFNERIFQPLIIVQRNKIHADNVAAAMNRFQDSTVAVVDGFSHQFEYLTTGRSLGELLAFEYGVHVISVMPYPIDGLLKGPDGRIYPNIKR